jgi:hypothetical protein
VSILSEVSDAVGSNILPPKTEPRPRGSSVYLPEEMWDQLEAIADQTKAEDPEKKGYSRNEVIVQFLRWGIREYEAERRAKKKSKE